VLADQADVVMSLVAGLKEKVDDEGAIRVRMKAVEDKLASSRGKLKKYISSELSDFGGDSDGSVSKGELLASTDDLVKEEMLGRDKKVDTSTRQENTNIPKKKRGRPRKEKGQADSPYKTTIQRKTSETCSESSDSSTSVVKAKRAPQLKYRKTLRRRKDSSSEEKQSNTITLFNANDFNRYFKGYIQREKESYDTKQKKQEESKRKSMNSVANYHENVLLDAVQIPAKLR